MSPVRWLLSVAVVSTEAITAAADFVHSETIIAAPQRLLVEGLVADYAVLSEPVPRFSFQHPQLPPGVHNLLQAQYRITVAISRGTGVWTTVWDSGNIDSHVHAGIEYAGKVLEPFRRYRWTAQWAAATTSVLGSVSSLSPPAVSTFETGPMAAADWHNASWLFGFPQARFEFQLPTADAIDWARLYIASPGCTRPTVNGRVPKPNLRGM